MLSKRKGAPLNNLITYTFPKLHSGKSWYVDFFCYDPVTQSMRRKKYMLDSIKKVSDRKKRAAEIIAIVSTRLSKGWNPWAEASNDRQYTLIKTVIGLYNKYLEKLVHTKVLKEKTCYDYLSRLNMLIDYNETIELYL